MLKDLLKNKLTPKELARVPSSFDIIGNKEKAVAIIEIPEEIKKRKRVIANAIMKQHKNVKSVLMKASPRFGVYRTRELKLIAGDKDTSVIHSEHGCRLFLDPRKAYFSPRESAERLRIAEKIQDGETVMIFFAGIGPFAIVIAKRSNAKGVIGIEINPGAVEYFVKSVKLNKLHNIEVIEGGVKELSKEYYGQCDRVLMPLPESAMNYLKEAVLCLKPGGIVHFYCFSEEDNINKAEKEINNIAKGMGKGIKFLEIRKVLPYGPRVFKYRIDFAVE